MLILGLDADTAKNASLAVVGGSFFALLLVLKFAKSIISKLLLVIILIAIGVLAFGQRDALTACINKVKVQAVAGNPISTTCELLGRNVSISLPVNT